MDAEGRPMNLVVIGARRDGQAHLVLDAVEERGDHRIVAFADEVRELWGTRVFHRPVLGAPSRLPDFLDEFHILGAVVAIGNGPARHRLAQICHDIGLQLPSIVHPMAHVSRYATLGEGIFVGQGAQILAGAVIDDLALIGAGTVVSHHVRIRHAATVGPNSTLAGRSQIGRFVFLGAAATILPDVSIGDNAVLGAGSVVVSHVPEGVTAAGVPAKPLTG
jgi:sugar O-acyltransferase (sialic acid O-acetyltransferase NeuD family)